MRFYIGCLYLLCVSILIACAKDPNHLRLGVITDLHYLSEKLMDDGVAITDYEKQGGKMVRDVPQVLDIVIADYMSSDIDILLIPGDLTKDGERESHLELTNKLQPLIDKGIRIYVIPGNHDVDVSNAVGFSGSTTYKVDNITANDFAQIYSEFGYKGAIDKDTSSLSYVAQLDNNTWLLAIDATLYKSDKTISRGEISKYTEQWILNILKKAKDSDIQVIGMMHYGLVEHFVYQSTLFKDYLVDDWQRLASLFADNGLKIMFTGHFHANDITEHTTGRGNKLYDIETGSLTCYPFAYRFAYLHQDELKISTKNVVAIPRNPMLADSSKNILKKLAQKKAIDKINNFGIAISDSLKNSISEIVSEFFVMHLAGDEKINEDLRKSIRLLYSEIDLPESIPIDKFEIDLYPSDNNVQIKLE